jgi:hypothetical protein
MKIIHIAQAGIRSVINTNKAGRRFFTLFGNTFPIKDMLGSKHKNPEALDFRFFQGTWSKAVDLITPEDRAKLQNLGVDCSPLDAPIAPAGAPQAQPQAQFTPMTPVEQELARMQKGVADAMELQGSERVKGLLKFIDESIQKVANLTDEAAQSDFIKSFMAFQAKFHNYSFHNVMLIWFQKPRAGYVAGYKKWLELGRQVNKWDEPIYILAPSTKSRQYGENEIQTYDQDVLQNLPERQYLRFMPVKVYDITDTIPLENWKDPKTGQGPFEPKTWRTDPNERMDEVTVLIEAGLNWAKSIGIDVSKEVMGETLGGFSAGDKIRLNDTFEGINLFSTLVHECAHEALHWKKGEEGKGRTEDSTQEAEIDAETTAYIVLQHYGFETKDTPNYLALFKATGEAIKKRRNSISNAVKTIINGIDKSMEAREIIEPEGEPQQVAAFNLGSYLEKIARKMDFVSLGRNPFARLDYIRKRVGVCSCDWCGQTKKCFQYGVWHDGGREAWDNGSFCSKICYRSYYR